MPTGQLEPLARYLRRAGADPAGAATDAQLLARFVAHGD